MELYFLWNKESPKKDIHSSFKLLSILDYVYDFIYNLYETIILLTLNTLTIK